MVFFLSLGLGYITNPYSLERLAFKLNECFNNKIYIFICLILAFIYVIKLLLGVGKYE